jgi:nucleotide-binding universal stress UspA family protein
MNPINSPLASLAAEDFRHARRQAALQRVISHLTGRSMDLLSFDEVCQQLKLEGSTTRGRREIPLAAIVGSAGRYNDFSRSFLPLQDHDESRWAGVKVAMTSPSGVPPIDVYQIGQVYFVLDGNHRVSVARQMGNSHIEAFVTECRTRVPLAPDDDPTNLIVKAEYADFLEKTGLDKHRPKANLQVTVPGQYWELETHIEAHRFLLGQAQGRELPYDEALLNWYDQVYLSVVEDIRERGILREFPKRTETDFYLWLLKHRAALEKKLGWHVELDAAATDLVSQHSPTPQRVVARVEEKLLGALTPESLAAGPAPGQWRQERLATRHDNHLFSDILVPVSGDATGWTALDMALQIAAREGSHLMGLHVVANKKAEQGEAAQSVKAEFEARCRAAGVSGELSIGVGKVVREICDRARWADLIVMYPATPPGARLLERLTSGSRNVIYQACRPVLTVPEAPSSLQRVLLAYDSSPKAREGLFVAAYLVDMWDIALTVLTVNDHQADLGQQLAYAQEYFNTCGLTADFVTEAGEVGPAILASAATHASDLIIMGGYGVKPIREVILGSKVDWVLRESHRPILVCR